MSDFLISTHSDVQWIDGHGIMDLQFHSLDDVSEHNAIYLAFPLQCVFASSDFFTHCCKMDRTIIIVPYIDCTCACLI